MPRTYRFFLNKSDSIDLEQNLILIEDKELLHQISKVLRLTSSSPETLEFLDGSGSVIKTKTEKISNNFASFKIEEKYQSKRELDLDLVFFLPIIKLDAFEIMLRKLVEIGICNFVPVAFARSQKQNIAAINSDKTQKRIRKIMQEAVEQCEGAILPKISSVIDFEQIEKHLRTDEIRFFANEKLADSSDSVPGTRLSDISNSKKVSLLVGPEGGLTEEEALKLENMGFHALSLGRRLLKAETAAIVLAASFISKI